MYGRDWFAVSELWLTGSFSLAASSSHCQIGGSQLPGIGMKQPTDIAGEQQKRERTIVRYNQRRSIVRQATIRVPVVPQDGS